MASFCEASAESQAKKIPTLRSGSGGLGMGPATILSIG